jgi:hypothetical protein
MTTTRTAFGYIASSNKLVGARIDRLLVAGGLVGRHISAISTVPETLQVLGGNYERFVSGQKLAHEVEWSAGY